MFKTIPDVLDMLSVDIQGSPHRKSGQSKIKFAEIFDVSSDWIYRNKEAKANELLVFFNQDKGTATICKMLNSADLVFPD